MKIKRFNESLEGSYNPADKILKVTFDGSFEVSMKRIENTNYYQNYYKVPDDRDSCIHYGIEEYINETGEGANHYSYELYDGLGNLIEDEEEFDDQIENIKKYNV